MRKKWMPAAAIACGLAALSLAVSAWTTSRFFEGGVTQEFCDYAEIGRNILEGRGFRTFAVFPFTLAYLDGRGIGFSGERPAPVLDRFPVQAYLSAAAELVGGKNDGAVLGLSAFLLALCVAATFLAGYRLFGAAEGALAALFLALDPSFQRGFVLWGLPDFSFLLLTLCATVLCIDGGPEGRPPRPRLTPGRPVVAGIAAGLAWLARSNFMIWLPLFAWALWSPRSGRAKRLACFFGAFVAASAPGWIYSFYWYGAPTPPTLSWNLAHHVVQDIYPLLSYRTFSVWDALAHHPAELWRKFAFDLRLQLADLPTMWQMHWLFPLSLLGLWQLRREGGPTWRWTRFMLAMLGLHIVVFSFLRYERLGPNVTGRYLIWWAPGAFLFAARGIIFLAGQLRNARMRGATTAAIAALACAWFGYFLFSPQGPQQHPDGLPVGRWPELAAAAEAAGPDGLVVTNLPGQMAWYGRRAAVGLPAEPEELAEIAKRHPVGSVLISVAPLGELRETPAWRPLLSDPARLKAFFRDRLHLPRMQTFPAAVVFSR